MRSDLSGDVIYFTTGRNFKLRLMISETPQKKKKKTLRNMVIHIDIVF